MEKSKVKSQKSILRPRSGLILSEIEVSKLHIKIKNFEFWIVVFTFYFLVLPLICFAQPISSTELINNAKQYDGKEVVYEGEVIGDVMLRGNYGWINLNDGQNAIGIWVPKDFTQLIVYEGAYNSKGDWLQVSGQFHRACLEHGGDLDIHAAFLKKTNSGREIRERMVPQKRQLAIYLGGIICILLIFKVYRKK